MTDEELVQAVATRVMEWAKHSRNTAHWTDAKDANSVGYKVRGLCCGRDEWNPLTNWNTCFEVVEAMRAKGFWFIFEDMTDRNECRARFHSYECSPKYCYSVSGQRAILEAALAAMEASCKSS